MGSRKNQPDVGFSEREHTADLALTVWGVDLAALFVNAAKGMFAASGAKIKRHAGETKHRIELHAQDDETLLVNFLSELLYLSERDQVGFKEYQVSLAEETLLAEVTAAALQSIEKHIKAVTYHDLAIRREPNGYRVEIVFDI